MDLRLTKGKPSVRSAEAISSKSYVHRLLIASALYGSGTKVVTNILSEDMKATAGALNSLGADVRISEADGGRYVIETAGTLKECPDGVREVFCAESGSTARFLLPAASLFGKSVTLTGSGRLPERPMGPLCDVLRDAGVSVSSDMLPITVSNKPKPGCYKIPGNVSSQFISGLLFALPLLGGTSAISIEGTLESAAYVEMTVDVLARFGVRIEKTGDGFKVYPAEASGDPGTCPADGKIIKAEGDWSNAAYVMAVASLGCGRLFPDFTVDGLDPGSIQGDRAAVSIFEKFGINISASGEESAAYTVSSRPEVPVDIDCSQIPDLVPALAVLAAYSDGASTFRNVERLRIKECDRVRAVSELLAAVSVKVDITSEGGHENMTVYGWPGKASAERPDVANSSAVSGSGAVITADSFNDHRIAMAAAALAFSEDEDVVIKGADAVNKSYPGFFDLIEKMGIMSTRAD
ncbi:MAG: 3-phosphoshikimate 1-carboxyvinyltransferase [Lachnospiraceae bacterium]|nr:3-phosphoshikimate 1-carboxyvinyltransferase [Lachnospiraceae bacterium]